MNKLFTYLLIIVLSSFAACHQTVKHISKDTSLQIDTTQNNNELTEKLIHPYKTKLDAEMNEVLVISNTDFPKERDKRETKLGNLITDLSFQTAWELYKDSLISKPDFCLLNFGGLRTSLPKGEITRGKIYELMPFENELVLVTISMNKMIKLEDYLYKNPQPVSAITITYSKDNLGAYHTCYYKGAGPDTTYKVVTTDYLLKGGDNMDFFKDHIKVEYMGIKLRDAIIDYCLDLNAKSELLTEPKFTNRIRWENK